MKEIPANFHPYRRTKVFGRDTLPAALKHAHKFDHGVWGRIVVRSGALRYRIHEPTEEVYTLTPEIPGVIEPMVGHDVEFLEDGEFFVEFYTEKERHRTLPAAHRDHLH